MDIYHVTPNKKINLADYSPSDTQLFDEDKEEAKEHLERVRSEIRQLQAVLYAEHKHKVLLVVQSIDAGGKDGTARKVFYGVNHLGFRVVPFKKPTVEELDHDYLWRIHQEVPSKGELVIFNRSHYEDVVAVRVRNIIDKKTCQRRFQHINEFERMLAEEGTTILKFYLHISKEEQKKRFLQRITEPHKHWKFNPADLEDRKLWDDYAKIYAEALSNTSTPWAPWYIIPSDKKWYRNLLIATTVLKALKKLNMEYPAAHFNPKTIQIT